MNIAIITGASSGMGREFALQIPHLYKNLDELWVISRRTERLKELQSEINIPLRIFDGDLQRDYVFEKVERELSRNQVNIRMLVNAAGYGKIGVINEIDTKEQCGMVDVNCKALTRMTCICLPYMKKNSRIIQLASAAAFCPQPGFAVYAASKAYVLSFSYALQREINDKGITVTAVCPGPVRTEFFDRAGSQVSGEKEAMIADAKDVVKQALIDSVHAKKISIYGPAMKLTRVLSKMFPDSILAWFMMKINHI